MAIGADVNVYAQAVYENLVELGLFKYILPWLLIFFLIYGILRKINIFGAEGRPEQQQLARRIDFVVGIVIASLIVAFVPFQTGQYAQFLSTYFGTVSVVMVVILGLILVVGMFTGKSLHEYTESLKWPLIFLGIVVVLFAISSGMFGVLFPPGVNAQIQGTIAGFFASPGTVAFFILLALILAAVYWGVWREEESEELSNEELIKKAKERGLVGGPE